MPPGVCSRVRTGRGGRSECHCSACDTLSLNHRGPCVVGFAADSKRHKWVAGRHCHPQQLRRRITIAFREFFFFVILFYVGNTSIHSPVDFTSSLAGATTTSVHPVVAGLGQLLRLPRRRPTAHLVGNGPANHGRV